MLLTNKEIGDALMRNGGRIGVTARELGVVYQTIYKRINTNKKLKELHIHLTECEIDLVEQALVRSAIDESKPACLIYYLQCKGRHRGWGEDTEILEDISTKLANLADRLPD